MLAIRRHGKSDTCVRPTPAGKPRSSPPPSLPAQVLVLKESTEVQEVAVTPLTPADEKAEVLASVPQEVRLTPRHQTPGRRGRCMRRRWLAAEWLSKANLDVSK